MTKIGIVGLGFVGTAIYQGLKNFYDIRGYDIDHTKSNSTLEDVVHSDIIFHVPTPMRLLVSDLVNCRDSNQNR